MYARISVLQIASIALMPAHQSNKKNWQMVNHNLCIRNSTSNSLLALKLGDQEVGKNYSFEMLLNTIAVDDHGAYSCIECLKACPLNSR